MKTHSNNFLTALACAEWNRAKVSERFCVTLKYGVYACFPLSRAIEKDYPIVCITL